MADVTSTLENLDTIFDSGKSQEALDGLEALNKQHPDNVEILWRLARAVFEIGTQAEGKADFQKSSYERAFSLSEKAVSVNKDHYGGYKWAGISLGYLGDHISTTEKIGNSFKIKNFFDTAAKLSPNDPTILHALGKWCFTIAGIGFIERTAASTLFATPPESSYDEALKYFVSANDKIEGDVSNLTRWAGIRFSNLLMLGQTYEALGDKNKARDAYKKLLALEITGAGSVSQRQNKEKAQAQLSAMDSSWW